MGIFKKKTKTEEREVCTVCQGSGLKQPTFVNSEQCDRCKGEGVEPK